VTPAKLFAQKDTFIEAEADVLKMLDTNVFQHFVGDRKNMNIERPERIFRWIAFVFCVCVSIGGAVVLWLTNQYPAIRVALFPVNVGIGFLLFSAVMGV